MSAQIIDLNARRRLIEVSRRADEIVAEVMTALRIRDEARPFVRLEKAQATSATLRAMLADTADLLEGLECASPEQTSAARIQAEAIRGMLTNAVITGTDARQST